MTRHKALAIVWGLIVCLVLGHNAYLWFGKRIVPDTDILALLPVQERDPVLQQSFTHMVDAAQQRVIVLVGTPEWKDTTRAADAYNAVLATRPDLIEQAKIGDDAESDWLAPFQKHSLVLLTAQQEKLLREQPPRYWTDAALAKLYSAFGGPKLGAFQDDPFGLFSGWVQERAKETPVRPRDGYLFVADSERQYVLAPLTLKVPALSIGAQQALLPLLDKAAAAARAAAPGANVISAGVVLHAAAAASQAEREMSTIGVGSIIGIILLTWLTFFSVRPIVLILLSIGIGFLGSLSVCWLLFGGVHLLTLVFGASLIGVAQDYGIYFLCNRLSADRSLDSVSLLRKLLPSLALTLAAAVIGYMGLALTPFPGLRHMAVFSAVGLVFAWMTVACWFPLLISSDTLSSGKLARVYGGALARWPQLTFNRMTLAGLALFAIVAAYGCSKLGANDDIRLLQTPPPHLIRDQIQVSKLLDVASPVQYYLVRGADAETVLQREEQLKRRLDPLIEAGRISGYQSLSNWVPSLKTQAERRALIESKLLADGGPLAVLAQEIEEDPQWTARTRAHLLSQTQRPDVDAFLASKQGEPWRHLWQGKVEGVYSSIVAVRGISAAALPVLREAGQGAEGVLWVDKVSEISTVLGRYREYMGWVVLGAYVVVFLLLFPRYRQRAWRVLAPTAIASLATLTVFGLIGQPLQLFHVLALMLLLGVGVDYGIFMQEQPDRRDSTPWLAVGLSAVNTILAFGLLGLSRTPALQAFGMTMLIGTTLVWLLVPCFATSNERHHASNAN